MGAPVNDWPVISLVTPSYNQGRYIRETIESVLSQGYPRLEYIVIDGGSTDETAAVLSEYAPRLAYVVSERDRGQADAINKGFARATGEVMAWLNSDDLLVPGALFKVAAAYRRRPDAILLGDVENFYEGGTRPSFVTQQHNVSLENARLLWNPDMAFHQPGIFVPAAVQRRVGDLDISLRYMFDRDWLIRLLAVAGVQYLHETLARFRLHGESKTVKEAERWPLEMEIVWARYRDHVPSAERAWYDASAQIAYATPFTQGAARDVRRARTHLRRAIRLKPLAFLRPANAAILARAWLPEGVVTILLSLRNSVRKFFRPMQRLAARRRRLQS